MIQIKEFPDRSFRDKAEMFTALRENKQVLINQKKYSGNKEADSFCFLTIPKNAKGETIKADTISFETINSLKLELVINTTNLLDSHSDVHLKGIWKKTIKEQKLLYLLQEHKMTFDHIISDDVKMSTKLMNWSDLGADYKGQTEALVFSVNIEKDRNPYMFEQYAKGRVKNHSVGMRYMKIELALNSDSKWDVDEKEVWNKYIDEIANKEDAEAQGYFWAVTEAKVIEGSAVPMGSNRITPTLSVEDNGAGKSTPNSEAAEKALRDRVNYYKNLI